MNCLKLNRCEGPNSCMRYLQYSFPVGKYRHGTSRALRTLFAIIILNAAIPVEYDLIFLKKHVSNGTQALELSFFGRWFYVSYGPDACYGDSSFRYLDSRSPRLSILSLKFIEFRWGLTNGLHSRPQTGSKNDCPIENKLDLFCLLANLMSRRRWLSPGRAGVEGATLWACLVPVTISCG